MTTDATVHPHRGATAFGAAAVVLLSAALALTLAVPDAEFAAFLAMILGGWSAGVAVVRASAGRLRTLGVNAAAAIVAVVALGSVRVTDPGGAAVIFVLAMAAIPAAAWIVISLLGRILAVPSKRARRAAVPRGVPEWEADVARDGALIRVRAVPRSMRALALAMAGATLVAGAGAAAAMIALGGIVQRLGPGLVIVLVGVLIALPVFLLFRAIIRRDTATYTLGFGRTELRLDGPNGTERFRYEEIDILRWRADSEYARVEVQSCDTRRTLLIGQAVPAPGYTAGLPPLSRRIVETLASAGLTAAPGRVLSFRRSPAQVVGRRAGRRGRR